MRSSLAVKLILAFLGVALTAAVLVAGLVRRSNADELYLLILEQQSTRVRDELLTYYRNNGSWNGIDHYMPRPQSQGQQTGQAQATGKVAPPPPQRPRFGVVDLNRKVVLPWGERQLGETIAADRISDSLALEVNGTTVGYFFAVEINIADSPEARAYLAHTDQALLWATLGAVALALLLGALLTRSLLRPISALTLATRALAQGGRGAQITVHGRDELAALSMAFNTMSHDLARAENARRQMTADIAHDLRTPLTVLGGYIESMHEGVLAATPERFAVMQSEVSQLSRLVDDLMTLARADAGEIKLNRQPVAVEGLLTRIAAAHAVSASRKEVSIEQQVAPALQPISIDEARITQVLGNLLSNALRHTPAGGRIVLGAAPHARGICLSVSDSGEGISADDLPFIFERFYRSDEARSGDGAESGLGLAIAKSLIAAHGGEISVTSAPGAGAYFEIKLPA